MKPKLLPGLAPILNGGLVGWRELPRVEPN
jgi:hypothetical protein